MSLLGLDISSSSTGWALILDDKKILEYGLISPVGGMSVTQRLYFFGNEIKKVIDKFQPDEIAIEETILVRGPKIMRTLARFSGVALFQAYSYQKREVKTYGPGEWKSKLGLKGNAMKPDVQLKICEMYNLLDVDKIKKYSTELEKLEKDLAENKLLSRRSIGTIEKNLIEGNKALKQLLKLQTKKSLTDEEKKNLAELELKKTEELKQIKEKKKNALQNIKTLTKNIDKISMNVYSDCGINPDIADAIGVAISLWREQ